MNKEELTGKVFSKNMSFYLKESDTVHSAYYVLLETISGKKVPIKDESDVVGMMSADSRDKAIRKGETFYKNL